MRKHIGKREVAVKYWAKAYRKGHPKYSRKQIAEALKKYAGFDVRRQITDSIEMEGLFEDLRDILAVNENIPNYLKPYMFDTLFDSDNKDDDAQELVDGLYEDLLERRTVKVAALDNKGDIREFNVKPGGKSLMFSVKDAERAAGGKDVKYVIFDFGDGVKYIGAVNRDLYEDPEWLEDMTGEGMTPVMLSDGGRPGDAESMWNGKREIDLPDDGYIEN